MNPMRVLIVEDEGIVAKDLQRSLKKLGYAVDQWAQNGEEGVRLAGEIHPDLILMDITLGKGITGIEAASRIRDQYDMPVIFLTAYSDKATLEHAKASQPYGYILKPFDENELRSHIEIAVYKHRVDREIRENRRFLADLLAHFPGFVYRCRLDGPETLEYVSGGVAAILGYVPEELLDRSAGNWNDMRHPEDAERVRFKILDAIKSGRPYETEYRLIGRSGEMRWVLEKGGGLRVGNSLLVEGFVIDVTDRKRAEETALRKHMLEGVGQVAGGIAHELNNYLMGVLGGLFLIKQVVRPNTEVYKKAEMLEQASERIRILSHQLIPFSPGGKPVLRRISVSRLVKDVARIRIMGSKSWHQLSLADDLWEIEADEGQLAQALHNVLQNAMDAMPEGGCIEISAENLERPSGNNPPTPERFVLISIRDHGPGIPEKDRPRIFEPFFTTKKGQSGLGLSAAHSIIHNHGGEISARPSPDEGSVITIHLPAVSPAVSAPAPPPGKTSVRGGRILVMDDDEHLRRLYGELLKMFGYECVICEEGEAAARMYGKQLEAGTPFDAVIMDLIVAEGLGGLEAAKKILEIDPSARIVVSSGYSADPVMANYRRHGFCAALRKPYAISEMNVVLKEAVRGGRKSTRE